jgi:phosphoheptose isomerase
VALNLNKLSESNFTENHFAQSLQVHGKSADVLLVVSAGGNSRALIEAIETAIDKNMTVLLLSAATDDLLAATVGYNDVLISTAEFSGQLATQAQFQIVQCICVLVDHQIFGGE